MPALRTVVHIDCVGCGTPVPLPGVVTSVTCESCRWQGALPPARWQWVLASRPATVGSGEQILGETQAADVSCPGCSALVPDAAIEAAVASGAASVACSRCHVPLPLRRLDASFPGHVSAVIGEGTHRRADAATVNVACSNCGAQLALDGSTSAPVCTFCGTRNTLAPDLWRQLRPLVHPFYVWTSRAAARLAAREASAIPASPAPTAGISRSAIGSIVGVTVAVVVGIVATIVGVVTHAVGSAVSAVGANGFTATGSSASRGWGVAGGSCGGMRAACATDKQAELVCKGGKFAVSMSCKGPKGCRLTNNGDTVSCDYTFADENDPCSVDDSACSTDRKAELTCDGTRFVKRATCKGPDGCALTPETNGGYTLSCDDHVADPGDACVGAGRVACDAGKKSLLVCKGGKFAQAQRCRHGCRIKPNLAANTTTIDCD